MLNKQKTSFVTVVGVLSALSIALLLLVPGLTIFPAAPYLKYDLMDIPMLIAGLTLGPVGGGLVLVIGSAIQSLLFGEGGLPGFVMHVLASGTLILVASLIYRRYKTTTAMIAGLVLGSLAMAAVMVPLNLIITVHWYGVPMDVVKAGLIPVTIPFNLLKAGLNSAITFAVVMAIKPVLNRFIQEKGQRQRAKA